MIVQGLNTLDQGINIIYCLDRCVYRKICFVFFEDLLYILFGDLLEYLIVVVYDVCERINQFFLILFIVLWI